MFATEIAKRKIHVGERKKKRKKNMTARGNVNTLVSHLIVAYFLCPTEIFKDIKEILGAVLLDNSKLTKNNVKQFLKYKNYIQEIYMRP